MPFRYTKLVTDSITFILHLNWRNMNAEEANIWEWPYT
jgi:hypothetical protein